MLCAMLSRADVIRHDADFIGLLRSVFAANLEPLEIFFHDLYCITCMHKSKPKLQHVPDDPRQLLDNSKQLADGSYSQEVECLGMT
jgi:hypothetical protein